MELILYSLSVVFIFRMLYYAIGEPASNYNPQSIFSKYVYFLAHKRLKKYHAESFLITGSSMECAIQRLQVKELALQKAMPLFRYEFMLGICPICTFFWVSTLFIFIPSLFLTSIINAIFIFSISNILNKIIIKWI